MDHGGPCIPLNRFRATNRHTALKKHQVTPLPRLNSTLYNVHSAGYSRETTKDIVRNYIREKPHGISPTPSTEVVEFDPSSRYVTPGATGGTFSARGQLVAVTLPSLHNEYYIPSRASKKQPITTQRFVPGEDRTVVPGLKLSTRDRLTLEHELLEEAKQRNRLTQLIPHRAQQPYLMAGFPITLQQRTGTGTPNTALLPPQPSMVQEAEPSQPKPDQPQPGAEQSAISLPGQSYASDIFLTQPPSQTTIEPIIGMDEITVSKFNNYRSPCSLLGRDKVAQLSAEFKKIAQDLITLGYSHAEQLVQGCKDPSHAVQVLDLNGDGYVDIKEYIVVMSLSHHYFKGSDIFFDQDKVEAKIKHLRGKYDELEAPTIQACLHGFSRLLISDGLMSEVLTALNCDPATNLAFIEYICIYMFWEELEDVILEQKLSGDTEIASYITAYLGASDSTFSFDEALSSTFL